MTPASAGGARDLGGWSLPRPAPVAWQPATNSLWLALYSLRMSAASDPYWREHLRQLGEFIKAQRALSQMSQRELARLADLSDTYLSQLERGRHEPSLTVLRALAESLGIRPDELILYAAGVPLRTDPVTSEEAIRADSRLTQAQRSALLTVLHSYLDANDAGTVE
jgi:transcriptional regulator with XRE-family HTH domain